MELEKGMYVRTNEGIGTVQRIYNNKNDCTVKFKKGHVKKWVTIFKVSHNIIDLIEAGDYVNGDLVLFAGATIWDSDGNILVKQVHINHNGYDWWLREDLIKSIVTKEQFENMSYKVGD